MCPQSSHSLKLGAHTCVLSSLPAWRPWGPLWTTSRIHPTRMCCALPQHANRALNPQLAFSIECAAVPEGSFALCQIWRTIWWLRPLLELCDLLPPCTCPPHGSPLLQTPQGKIQPLLSVQSSQQRGTQDSPKASSDCCHQANNNFVKCTLTIQLFTKIRLDRQC